MMVFSFFPCFLPFLIFCTRLTPRKATGCPVVDVAVRYWPRFYNCRLQQCCSRCCAGGHRISSSSHGSRRGENGVGKSGIEKVSVWSSGVLLRDLPFFLSPLYFQFLRRTSPRCLLVHTSLCHFVVTLLSRQVFCFSRFFSLLHCYCLLTLETACHVDKLGETRSQPVRECGESVRGPFAFER